MLSGFGTDFIYAVLAFALVLIPAIIIHELGHFFAAKWVGINVLEFGIGFPPRAMRLFMWGETEFTLNWLPIGGFVRPLGEDFIGPVDASEETDQEKRKNDDQYISERDELLARGVPESKMMSVNEAKPLARIFFMVAGAGANFISAIVFFIVAALLGLRQEVGARVQLSDLSASGVFAGTSVVMGDVVEKVNGEYFASAEIFLQAWTTNNGKPVTLTMRSLDKGENYEVVVTPKSNNITPQVLILGVAEDSPGQKAGLLPGDAIVKVDGYSIPNGIEPSVYLQQITTQKAGQGVELTVIRKGETMNFTMIPRLDPPQGQGRIGLSIASQYSLTDGFALIRAEAQTKLVPQPLDKAVTYGFKTTGDILGVIVSIPSRIIERKISPEEVRPVSIIGISRIGGKILEQSVADGSPSFILQFIASVSIFLGFTNLLPFPPLDGGRVVFVLIEMVRGKPVPISIEKTITIVGMLLLLGLGLFVMLLDVIQPITLP
jgi:regulator of sigma E protease